MGHGDGLFAYAYEASGVTAYGTRSGVSASSNDGPGVNGRSERGDGVHGFSANAAGVYGGSDLYYGVVGRSNSGLAGFFDGNVTVAGTLSKAAGSFKIDHPLDPENKFLSHSFVESPDMKNIYDGVATLDAAGVATVELPVWFEALNRDFRYQLTAVGAPAPELHVARGVAGHRFTIAGGSAGLEVSWQVTGIRQDAYAERHRIPVEEDKKPEERGLYLNPEAWGSRHLAASTTPACTPWRSTPAAATWPRKWACGSKRSTSSRNGWCRAAASLAERPSAMGSRSCPRSSSLEAACSGLGSTHEIRPVPAASFARRAVVS